MSDKHTPFPPSPSAYTHTHNANRSLNSTPTQLSPSFGRLWRPTVQPLKWAANPCTGSQAYYNAQSYRSISHCVSVRAIGLCACMCMFRHVSICLSASCIKQCAYMRRWKWLLFLSCVTSVIAIYPLAAFSKSATNCHCRKKIPLLPNKCLSLLLSPFHWREVITGPYESEMNKSARGWMGGHGCRASGEWGHINSSPATDGGPQLPCLHLCPHHLHQFLPWPQRRAPRHEAGAIFHSSDVHKSP